ncbi:MAG: TonB family protein [Bacteroidia bacterium]|nr:TonB family protein [Bacteroidia bacterium]
MKKLFFIVLIFSLSGNLFSQSPLPKNGVYISYWPGTQTISEYGFYKNEKKDGTWVKYENTGKLKEVYNYKDGSKEGTYILFDVYGNPTREGRISKGYFTGIEYQYENGILWKKHKYLKPLATNEGLLDQPYPIVVVFETEYDLNTGLMRNEGKVVEGKKDSVWKWYDEKGNIKGIETLLLGKKNGISQRFYANGQLAESAFFLKGEMDGTRLMLTENGDTTEYGNYTKGRRNGFFIIHESLRIKDLGNDQKEYFVRGNYTDGYMNGNFILKYPNGKIASNENYVGGKLNGNRKLFYPGGKISYEANYVNFKLNGKELRYYENGNPRQLTEYVNGTMVGKQITYYENGKPSEETVYENGKMNSFTRYYENGKLKEKRIYMNGKLLKQEFYDEKGKKAELSIPKTALELKKKKEKLNKEIKELNKILEESGKQKLTTIGGDHLPSDYVNKDTTIYTFVEVMPEFPGGNSAMLRYFGSNLKYPEIEKDSDFPAKCYFSFVVNETGKVENAQVIKGSGNLDMDKEALRVINSFPQFKPGKQNGKTVKVKMNIPISCMLPK